MASRSIANKNLQSSICWHTTTKQKQKKIVQRIEFLIFYVIASREKERQRQQKKICFMNNRNCICMYLLHIVHIGFCVLCASPNKTYTFITLKYNIII